MPDKGIERIGCRAAQGYRGICLVRELVGLFRYLSTAVSLAMAAAEAGKNVLLIDLDPRAAETNPQ
ncbi:hypothetical protein [Glutamicibacter sp.]|uniref:hypothetical protein n=1 Tax=Glutamicibacter sp. TaxID=1931995 RepID=UPI003D6C048A